MEINLVQSRKIEIPPFVDSENRNCIYKNCVIGHSLMQQKFNVTWPLGINTKVTKGSDVDKDLWSEDKDFEFEDKDL